MPLLTGLRGYTVIWVGQLFSSLGAGMTAFALSLWLWQETQSATAFSLLGVVTFAPLIFITPIVGALVDRWNQHLKLVLMIGDVARLLTSLGLLALLLGHLMALPWLYLLVFLQAAANAFQWPADSAATTVMLRKEDYARAGGIQSVVTSLAAILAPLLGAVLYPRIGLNGIVALDMLGGLLALLSLWPVYVPNPPVSETGAASQTGLLAESLYGFRFILARPSLLALQLVFLFGNFLNGLSVSLQTPLVLARSGNDSGVLATVQTAGGISGLLAGLLIARWGGPRRRIHGVLLGWAISCGMMLCYGLGNGLLPWVMGSLLGAFGGPLTNSSNQAIWLSKTPPDLQGKVFAARRVLAMLALPLATLVAGPLADRVLNPAMQTGGSLAGVFGPVLGTGTGAGMALLSAACGLVGLAVMLGMYGVPVVRDVEGRVPDFDGESLDHLADT